MATLKEHQAAMVELLANGSGIPASATRLAHAMHDVLEVLSGTAMGRDLKDGYDVRCDATTPGLNDKALSKREKALKTDSPAKWPTTAEQRVKELENTIRQLKANNAKLKRELIDLGDNFTEALSKLHTAEKHLGLVAPEQAGCRKQDTQVCDHEFVYDKVTLGPTCALCGEWGKDD